MPIRKGGIGFRRIVIFPIGLMILTIVSAQKNKASGPPSERWLHVFAKIQADININADSFYVHGITMVPINNDIEILEIDRKIILNKQQINIPTMML